MSSGRDVNVDVALATGRVAGRAAGAARTARTAAAGRARSEPEREERPLLLLQRKELLLGAHRRIRRRLL